MGTERDRLVKTLMASKVPLDIPSDAIVIIEGVRTPVTKANRGKLKDFRADQLLSVVLKELLLRVNLPGSFVDDIAVGNVLQPGAGATMSRMAMLVAGLPSTVPIYAVNRQCASGLQAIACIAASIDSGGIACGIAAGVESMTHSTLESATPVVCWSAVKQSEEANECTTPMGITSENVAKQFRISRQDQDAFSLTSHAKASTARREGFFEHEIVAVGGVREDDGIRDDTSVEALKKLKPAFAKGGTTTAGNSSQLSDGAAAVLVARASFAANMGLPILGILRSYKVVGVPPSIMGVGPAFAIPTAVRAAGLHMSDIDVFEINEAFASQCLFCIRHLGIPVEKVNPLGGAIALGHPLGCSGTRLVVTLLHYLKRTGKRYGVVSLCIGTGMGAAAVYENPHFTDSDSGISSGSDFDSKNNSSLRSKL